MELWHEASLQHRGGHLPYLIPVVAVAAGALMLGEVITVHVVAGGLLMLAGVAAAQFGPALVARR